MKSPKSVVPLLSLIVLLIYGGACTETKVVEKLVPSSSGTGQVDTAQPESGTNGNNAATPGPLEVPNTSDTKVKDIVKDIVAPTVVSVNPADESAGASLATEISATFSEDIQPDTVTAQSLVVKDSAGVLVTGAVSYDATGKMAVFKPMTPLIDSESYSVTITPDIKDPAGNPLPMTYTTTFKASKMPVVAMCVGWQHTAAVKENGTVWTWGRNDFGQLGDGTLLDHNKPTRVKELSNVVSVACGQSFTLALLKDGTVWAWGANNRGQLGDGTTTDHLQPAPIPGLSAVHEIATCLSAGFALKKDGTVWAWGRNNVGQLGDGTTVDRAVPMQVTMPGKVTAIAAGQNYVLALGADVNAPDVTRVYAWGGNFFGQLGKGSKSSSSAAQSAPLLVVDGAGQPVTDIRSISSSGLMSFAITNDNRLLGWGYKGAGNGTTMDQPSAVEIMKDVQSVSHGVNAQHAFAATTTGELWGWGNNDKLQLMMYDPEAFIVSPTRIGVLDHIKAMATGVWHSAILKDDGSVMAAGYNISGELGDGSASFYTNHPNKLTTLPPSQQISGRSALTQDGKVWAWGRNTECELGLASESAEIMVPVPIKGIPDKVIQISRSGTHMLALTDKGEVWAWGGNAYGQLGTGLPATEKKSCIPARVKTPDGQGTLGGIVSIYASHYSTQAPLADRSVSYALQKDAQGKVMVLAWGNNYYGQLGNGKSGATEEFNNLPQVVQGLPDNVVEITGVGKYYARTSDGKLYQLMAKPVEVVLGSGGAKVVKVVSGQAQVLFALDNGQVWSFGGNYYGQLGSNQPVLVSTYDTTPKQVVGIDNAVDLAANGHNSAAITADKRMFVWGNNNVGQLGNGTSRLQPVPIPVNIADGKPLENVAAVSIASIGAYDFSGVMVVLQSDGTVWDWGFLNIKPTYLIREGEPAFRSTPATVNWP